VSVFFLNVTLARNSVLPEDNLRIETCWSDFEGFNVKKIMYVH